MSVASAISGFVARSSIHARALMIQRTLGTRRAAGYLRNQGVTMRLALHVLAR